jgi:molybdopterin-guanine dinucleotide biosynthesis protein MobB
MDMAETDGVPVLAVCGPRNSGKTTLIEAVMPRLLALGLKVAVLKESGGPLDVDRPRKDSDRLFRAGADVVLLAGEEQFLRRHGGGDLRLQDAVAEASEFYDLVLVEGHTRTTLPRVWLADEGGAACAEPVEAARPELVEGACPEGDAPALAQLPWNSDRPAAFLAIIEEWLPRLWRAAPVYAGVLIGGASTRMGTPKHLLQAAGQSWLERTVGQLAGSAPETVLLGRGEVPASLAGLRRLPDVPDVSGPMAGVLSAMRWARRASWLIVACDMPQIAREAVDWLLGLRRPGVWAVIPRLGEGRPLEPLLACYDFRSRPLLERLAASGRFRIAEIARSSKVVTPAPPADLAKAWANVNRPEDLADLSGNRP